MGRLAAGAADRLTTFSRHLAEACAIPLPACGRRCAAARPARASPCAGALPPRCLRLWSTYLTPLPLKEKSPCPAHLCVESRAFDAWNTCVTLGLAHLSCSKRALRVQGAAFPACWPPIAAKRTTRHTHTMQVSAEHSRGRRGSRGRWWRQGGGGYCSGVVAVRKSPLRCRSDCSCRAAPAPAGCTSPETDDTLLDGHPRYKQVTGTALSPTAGAALGSAVAQRPCAKQILF